MVFLEDLLREKRIELQKRRIRQSYGGKMKAYNIEDRGKVPIKVIKTEIAVIQTFINQKMNALRE